jgi:hypothetical protein
MDTSKFLEEFKSAIQSGMFTRTTNLWPLIRVCNKQGTIFCPITAVCFYKHGVRYQICDFEQAARLLGIPYPLYFQLMEIADRGFIYSDPASRDLYLKMRSIVDEYETVLPQV